MRNAWQEWRLVMGWGDTFFWGSLLALAVAGLIVGVLS